MARFISLSDAQQRDAQVALVSQMHHRTADRNLIGPSRESVHYERLIKSTEMTTLAALVRTYGSLEAVATALITSDPEIDLHQVGRRLRNAARVYLQQSGEVLYAARVMQVVYGPDGVEKSRQDFSDVPATVGEESKPLVWTGRLMTPDEVVHRFVMARCFQIRHVNGLTYDFLHGIATTLHNAAKLLYVGAGPKGQGPLIFTLNGSPYRGFLEGKVAGDGYLLILHCSNLELKVPKELGSSLAKSYHSPQGDS